MKQNILILIILCLINYQQAFGKENFSFNFENYSTGKTPTNWTQNFTGTGKNSQWEIINDQGNKVLAQLSAQNRGGHFNLIVFDDLNLKNAELTVKLKGVAGKRDQGGGFVWRYIDANNYYIVRANPLEDNVVLYKMKNGIRTDLPVLNKDKSYGVDVTKLGNNWNLLSIKISNELFSVFLNGKHIFQVKDSTFSKAGKVGLWTKADAVTYFDNFKIIE